MAEIEWPISISWNPDDFRRLLRYVDENGVEHIPTDEDFARWADEDDEDERNTDAALDG